MSRRAGPRGLAAVLVVYPKLLAVLAALAAVPARAAFPPVPVSQFDMTGFLQAATLGGSDALAGGTLTVNGQVVVVPRNVIVTFPAAFLTWEQVFQFAPPPYGPTQTGLAMADSPAPFVPYEVHVIGNRVAMPGGTDQYIAGMVSIAQQSLNSGQGYVNFIDYSTGELRVGGILGDPTTGQRVRMNDPTGRFNGGPGDGTALPGRLSPDVRFAVDPENPNVRSETGYPMCLPSKAGGDALCPLANRPVDPTTGTFATQINMPAVPNCDAQNGVTGMDPCLMAPLQVGDYVSYAGTLMKDGSQPSAGPNPVIAPLNASYVSAWQITANVGIWTAPGTDPAYVATDVTLIGVGGVSALGAAEAAFRTRFEGFTTDPFRFDPTDANCQDPAFKKAAGVRCSIVDLYAIDVDPCSATMTDRPYGGIDVDQGPPIGVKPGRWRFRPPSRMIPLAGASGVFDPVTQTMHARLRGATPMKTKNGLLAGQYVSPIAEYIFPENGVTGTAIVPNNFEAIPFIANGIGPIAGPGSPVAGQLAPWPGGGTVVNGLPGAPPPVVCAVATQAPPTASAGANQSVLTGATVTLDGSGSSDPNGLTLSYAWAQTGGASTVTLSSPTAMFPTFTAPATADTLTFSLVVTDAAGLTSTPASVTVTVAPPAPVALAPVADAGQAQTVASGANAVLNGSASSDPNVPAQALSFLWTAPAGVTLSSATAANPFFRAPQNPGPNPLVLTLGLTVTNAAGLSSTASVAITVSPALKPIASAGPDQTVLQNSNVALSGLASSDPNGLPLSFSWVQVAGQPVALTGANTATPTFRTPSFSAGSLTLAFQLTVSDGVPLASDPAVVTLTVLAKADTITIASAVYRTSQQRLTVTATSSAAGAALYLADPSQPKPASCAVNPLPAACILMTPVAGVPTAQLVGVVVPNNVTVMSSLGGTATSSITKLK
ncbi:MAG TPA: PKD domain-containing protein [Anaeromyxobacteraceae bacterium]|nr:PKD domain-containing protein [Anaeromyxobacteraceae bacterium]